MKNFFRENFPIIFVGLINFIESLGKDLLFIPYYILGYPFFYLSESKKEYFYNLKNNLSEPLLWLCVILIIVQIYLWKKHKRLFKNIPIILILSDLTLLPLIIFSENNHFDLLSFLRNEWFLYGSILFVNLIFIVQIIIWLSKKNKKYSHLAYK